MAKVLKPYALRVDFDDEGGIVSRSRIDKVFYLEDGVEEFSGKTQMVELTEEAFAGFVGGTFAALNAQIAALQAQVESMTTAAAERDAALANKTAALAAAQAQLDAATATIAARDATIDALEHPPAPDDPVVSALQARVAMKRAGVLGAVLAYMDGLPEDNETRIYWEYATQFHRSNPVLTGVATLLGMTDEEVDDLFAAAQAIS